MELNKLNKYQTPITEELQKSLPKEVWEDLLDFIGSIKFIRNLIAPEEVRGFAKDRPKDKDGKIIVDLTNPHILEDMDFFRERAIFYEKNKCYTHLRPNPNPRSEFAEFWREEKRRWKDGLVRPSDGEWIPGYYYFYLNYCPIWLNEVIEDNGVKKKSDRIRKFPKVWLGDYLFFHYFDQAVLNGNHVKMLKTRGIGASFKLACISPCNMYTKPGLPNFHLASDKTFLEGDKGVFGKIIDNLDWIASETPFPRLRIINRISDMEIQLGYQDEYGRRRGLKSAVFGISLKDSPHKVRGVRGPLIHYEEDGVFPNIETAWSTNRKAVEDGNNVYGTMVAAGTGGTIGANFEGSEKLFRNPKAYNIYGIPNVFDKNSDGNVECGFFWPAYINRANCYNESNGESDIIRALVEILQDRFLVKYNSSDPLAITQKKSEEPITPAEAVMQTSGTIFPVSDLKEYLGDIKMQGIKFYDKHYVGDLVISKDIIKWELSNNKSPLRSYQVSGNLEGAIEIFQMPQYGRENKPIRGRYIAGIDPVDDDSGTSLCSIFIFDLFYDTIVAEYTGRPKFADDFYEICKRLLLFYDAKALYEAHPYSQKIKLPTGETKLWGDIKIGDELFSPNGNTVKVIDIPIDEYMPIYKISLGDGREVFASDNHIWSAFKLNTHTNILKNYTTVQMMNIGTQNKHNQNNFFIPNGGLVNYQNKEVPIDPYSFGLILAEGSMIGSHCTKNQVQISSSIEDMEFYKKVSPYQVRKIGIKGFSWSLIIDGCKEKIKSLGLLNSRSETKFIPDIYMYNSKEVRLELLKGLMDGDGCAVKNGSSVYITSSKKLSEDIMSLCRSLGFNCKCTTNKTKKLDSHRVIIYTDDCIFKLPRKVNNQYKHFYNKKGSKASSYINKIAIIKIEFSHYEKGKCVTVDSEDGLYMVGDYVVTHNCNKKGLFGYFTQNSCTHLLAENPKHLKDQDMMRKGNYGNKAYGVHATSDINAYARRLQKDWLLKIAHPDFQEVSPEGEIIYSKLNMHLIRSIGYLEELIAWNADGNYDRCSAMGMVMIMREETKQYIDGIKSQSDPVKDIVNSDYFKKNYDDKMKRFSYKELLDMSNRYLKK